MKHPEVPNPPFTVKFSFHLQKDCHIPDEFPFQSLERSASLTFDEDTLAHPFFFMQPMEQLIIRGIEGNGSKALEGLANSNDYDRIVISEWSVTPTAVPLPASPVSELDLLELLKALVKDCMASDFNEHWDSYKNAIAFIEKSDL